MRFPSLFLAVFIVGCQKPVVYGDVAVSSSAFSVQSRLSVNEFRFCVPKIRYADSGEEFDFRPGLIDLSDGGAMDWGTATIPTSTSIERIKIVLRRDTVLCGVDFSLRFNGQASTDEIEMKFKFTPPLLVTSTIKLSFSRIVAALLVAANSGGFTADVMKRVVEENEDAATP